MTGERRRGFTLIELMVTIAIIGLMFGLVFLKIDSLVPGTRLQSDARALKSNLELAFNYSVVSGRVVLFQYDLDQRCYRFYHPFELSDDQTEVIGNGETTILDWTSLEDDVKFADVQVGEGAPVARGTVIITIEPRGVATGHIVHLARESNPDKVFSVFLSPLLGDVDVTEGYQQPEVLEGDDAS